jgi:hypothetical protein
LVWLAHGAAGDGVEVQEGTHIRTLWLQCPPIEAYAHRIALPRLPVSRSYPINSIPLAKRGTGCCMAAGADRRSLAKPARSGLITSAHQRGQREDGHQAPSPVARQDPDFFRRLHPLRQRRDLYPAQNMPIAPANPARAATPPRMRAGVAANSISSTWTPPGTATSMKPYGVLGVIAMGRPSTDARQPGK